ncbi:MAG: hypothetical protein V1709_02685, partial [Planctomycetota bacterium]
MKKVFLIGSIIFNLVLIILLVVIALPLTKLLQKDNDSKAELQQTMISLENARKQINNLEIENKRLAGNLSALEKELISAKASLTVIQKEKDISFNQSPPSIANQFKDALLTGQSMDEKAVKARELGKMFVKMYSPSQNRQATSRADMSRQYAEVLKLMADLGLSEKTWSGADDYFSLLNSPEELTVCSNILAGIFDESGQPMNNEQITQCQSIFAKLGNLNKQITNENQTLTEKAIARLQNTDIINSISQELSGIFTSEQKESFGKNPIDGVPNILDLDSNLLNIRSIPLSQFKNQNEASQYVLENLSGMVNASDEEKTNIKPIAEQYISDYTTLRKNMELSYDKNLMDYYLQRNKPNDQNKISEYYLEREKLFQTNPDYKKAKIALDIEFLQVRNKYFKDIAKTVSTEKAAALINSPPVIVHYSGIE